LEIFRLEAVHKIYRIISVRSTMNKELDEVIIGGTCCWANT